MNIPELEERIAQLKASIAQLQNENEMLRMQRSKPFGFIQAVSTAYIYEAQVKSAADKYGFY